MVYTSRIRGNADRRPQAFWGAFIPAAINFVGGLITSSQQAKAQKRALEEQQRLAQQQLNISNQNQLASTLNNYANAQQSYDDKDYNLKYRIGGVKRLGGRNIMITDGGNAKRIGNNTYILRGGSHEDINETGQTGIGINVGGNEIEAEGGEVAQRKGNSLRIYSAQPILGGMSPAQAIMRGYNKDKVFAAQQRFKKNNNINDDGSKATFGNLISMPDIGNRIVEYFTGTGRYASHPVKVTPKTVAKKPIRNGQVGNFKVVNGRRIPNEKPLRRVYPEFDIISMGKGLPVGKAAKATARAAKNEVSYINRISKSRLYSDNPIVNTYATYARRYNLPDKARVPYMIRRVKSDELPSINNGRIKMNGDRFKHTNFTYDRPVVSHRKGKWDTAQQTYLINGRRLVSENKGNWGSIEPSDMFTIKDPKGGLTIPTKDVVLVSGHKGLLTQAKNSGIKTATSPQLQEIEGSITPRESLGHFNLAGGERRHYNTPYWIDVNNIVKEYGTPKLKDVRLLEELTGLKSGVSKLDKNAIKIINDAKGFNRLSLNEAEQIMNQTYPNGRGVNFINDREAYVTSELPYNNLFYDPATHAEANYVFPKRLGGHCKYRLGGGLTSKDRGSSKHPYSSVSSKDFAGGNRSYPIPTKADAIDALRLAGLHGRSDVRSKVYSKYPELRKKAAIGTLTTPIDAKNSYIWDLLGGDRNSQSITSDLKTILGLNDMYGAEDGHNANTQYAGISIPYLTQIIKNSPRVAKSILHGTKLYGRDLKALVEAEGESAYNKVRRMFRGNNNAYSNITNTYSPNINTKFTGNPNNNIRPYVERVNPVRGANTRRAYNTAKMQSANSELKMINNPEYAEQIVGNTVRNFSKNMSGKALQSAIGVSKYQPSNFVKYGIPAFASLAAYEYAGRETDNTKKPVSAQKDAKGQTISPYIARPQEPAEPQTKKAAPARRDTVVTKPATRQVPDSIARKDTTRTDTTKQVNKVVKRQVRTTPQYTGNTTRGNYQLHDGETKVINGVKYTRRGNTIINHKTNVGYIYDKGGNYTGQADYSKVGNFNQAFDAARAAGRSQFIYRAGKYNNYSTVKETNAKKEALNRRVGARRIAKRMGGLTNPPVGSRRKYLPGGTANPWDEYKLPDYGGTAPWQVSNKYAVNVPYPIGKYDLPITTITAKKDTFNDEMSRRMRAGVQNLKDSSDTNTTVPYLGRQSSFKPQAQDYIGLGIDTLAALGSGMFTRSAYNKMNFDYALPNYVDESPVAFDTTYHNEAQRANIERNRLNTRGLITGNTSSAQTALNLMQKTDTDAMMETNKLLDEKSNKEVELRNQNLANEQQVRARNAAARNQYYQNVAQIRNAALEARNNIELAKAQSIGADLSGLSQAWTNFASTVENRYDTRQNEIAAISSANNPSVVKNAISLGYNLSPEVLANLYKNSKNDELRNTILGRLSPYERKRYGIK